MADIAPLNYERWAVIVSPLEVAAVQEGGYVVPLRHPEGLVQLGASMSSVDSRSKESLVEKTLGPEKAPQKISKSKSAPPPAPPVSNPTDMVLSQPLPMEVIASAREQPVPNRNEVLASYVPVQEPSAPVIRVTG